MLNSWFYSLASAVLLGLMFVPQHEHVATRIYHLSKFYEYVDVLGVRAGGGEIELHFAVHHLTTPYLTYVRVLYYSQGWKVVAAPNAFHHVLMYAYFGGAGALRSVLPVTGTIQLLLGLGGEAWLLWKKRVGWEQPLWPHEFAISLFSIYFVLWLRELRQKASIKAKVAKFKST
ncbi:hypothetical protein J3459_010070 [Metarhizium acridum]|nr:hypothetical protein J3459_010070 [Metarhizium acridum]